MMFGVIGIPIRAQLGLGSTEFGLLTATPVLTGAIFRLPLGIWTDRFGGRIIMLLLLMPARSRFGCPPMRPRSGSFCCSDWRSVSSALRFRSARLTSRASFPKERRGFAMGFFGAGTIGAALNMFVAPWLIEAYGWQMVPKVYAVALLVDGAVVLGVVRA